MITGPQIRQARQLLGWEVRTLVREARVPASLVERTERIDGEAPITLKHEHALRRAFEAAGVEFTNGDAPGVRLRSKP